MSADQAQPGSAIERGDSPDPIDWRPGDPATLANPFPVFQRLRDEDPCHWSPRLKSWVLTRYDDIKAVCLDRERLSSDRLRPYFATLPGPDIERISDIIRYLSLWMVFKDAPEHTRLRRLTGKVFSAPAMQGMRAATHQIAQRLIERIAERDEFDFIADYAGPLPCLVIMALLGVDEADLADVKRMSDDIALFIGSSRVSGEKYDTAQAATREMADFFLALIARRRADPRDDAITQMVQLRDGDDRFSDDELVATCILMLFAGHETTTNHIANGMLALMHHPAQATLLRDDPSLAAAAVEELLRYDGPSGAQVRVVREAHQLHGKTLAVGERVFLMLNAANRDERAYAQPDALDIHRDGPPHLTFGFGLHICLGFPLARTEGQVALPAALARWPAMQPTTDSQPWLNSLVFRGMTALPVRVKRA